MDTAELVLEYIKVLAWPVVVGGALLAFRSQIAAKLKDLSRVSTPIGDADFEAKKLEEKADAAIARQDAQTPPPEPGPEPGPGPKTGPDGGTGEGTGGGGSKQTEPPREPEVESSPDRGRDDAAQLTMDRARFIALTEAAQVLANPPDFEVALDVASTSPNAAVMFAYTELEKVARAAWTVDRMEPAAARLNLPIMVRDLSDGLDPEFPAIARNLAELRNRVVHGGAEMSANGALDFIATCDRLAEVLSRQARSKLRHPSRAGALHDLVARRDRWLADAWPDLDPDARARAWRAM